MDSQPQPLSEPVQDTLIRFLQQAPGHWNESVALFAIGVDLDRFEASIPQIARQTRFSEPQLRELVDSARQAEHGDAPKVPKQHLVSRVLQREWEAEPGDGVSRYSLHVGLNPGGHPWPPEEIAFLRDYVKIDSQATEDVWNETETNLPEALTAVKARSLFQNKQHITTIRDIVALHYARSYEVLEDHKRTWSTGIQMRIAELLEYPDYLDDVFWLRWGLCLPYYAPDARLQVANELSAKTQKLFDRGIAFRFRIVDLFEGAKQYLADAGIRILRPEAGSEFLISDAPVIVSAVPGQRHGISSGIPIGHASEVYLPLAPKLAVVLDLKNSHNSSVEIKSDEVERYNQWEVEAAVHDVIMRPGSALEHFPETVRTARNDRT